jgi:Bacteriophage head to tail connecting protein
LFPKTAAAAVTQCVKDEPYKEIKCRRVVMPSGEYDKGYEGSGQFKRRHPYVSIYVDLENDVILEEVFVPSIDYVIPRWVTMPGSPYAFSPAVNIALPDARMLQQIGQTLLEAGQKAVDPPKVAVGEAITGGVNTYAGGVTFVDADYDERTGEALRDLPIDTRGLNWGVAREQVSQSLIREAFYLNAVQLPELKGDMTAYETQKRVEEYIRQALPLFEPMEVEYNGGLCEKAFEIGLRMKAFGSLFDMPEELIGQNVRFKFESPLQTATERAKANTFMQAGEMLQVALGLDPALRHDLDLNKAFREAALGLGMPADWVRDEEEADKLKAQDRQQTEAKGQQMEQIAQAQAASEVVKNVGGLEAVQGMAQSANQQAARSIPAQRMIRNPETNKVTGIRPGQ